MLDEGWRARVEKLAGSHASTVLGSVRPALELVTDGGPDRHPIGWFGGLPAMGKRWPRYKERPLSLLCSLDLRSLRALLPDQPSVSGSRDFALFFYDVVGHEEGEKMEGEAFQVLLGYEGESIQGPPVEARVYPRTHVWARSAAALPPAIKGVPWDLLDEVATELGQDEAGYRHLVCGYPDYPACDVANVAEDRSGSSWTQLNHLLQLVDDDEADFAWGDFGRVLYFTRREGLEGSGVIGVTERFGGTF